MYDQSTWQYDGHDLYAAAGLRKASGMSSTIIQLLLGNIGRPRGGILALRGHASIQGSIDIPTLFDLLPSYLPMPTAGVHADLESYLATFESKDQRGFWASSDAYTVSLLRAWWGDHATADNGFASTICLGAPAIAAPTQPS